MRISDWSSDVCSSDLRSGRAHRLLSRQRRFESLHDPRWDRERRCRGSVRVGVSTRLQAKGKAPMKTTLLAIDGMHCDGCARTIEALLARLPGVHKVEASFEERRARVLHYPKSVSATETAAAVATGGFPPRAATRGARR